MSTRKRNEFLEGDESDDGLDNGYDSEEAEQSRGQIATHASKRRKIDADSEASFESFADDDDNDDTAASAVVAKSKTHGKPALARREEQEEEAQTEDLPPLAEHKSALSHDKKVRVDAKVKSASLKQVEAAAKAMHKSGVIYISRVPPFMKPQTLRHLLAPHASKGLGRIFFTPEDHAAHLRRVKNGGNKKKSFSDGWVEFTSKREAKNAAELLNGNIIGGKKGNFYHDDLWNMKYLKGFKWNHLTEQMANENAERAARVREDIRKTRQENKAFVDDIERAKVVSGMESKRAAKKGRDGGQSGPSRAAAGTRQEREFKQRAPRVRDGPEKAKPPSSDAGRVLSKIF